MGIASTQFIKNLMPVPDPAHIDANQQLNIVKTAANTNPIRDPNCPLGSFIRLEYRSTVQGRG